MATRAFQPPALPIAPAIGGLFVLLAIYALWSVPGLAAMWGLSAAAPVVLVAWLAAAALTVPVHRAPPRGMLLVGTVVVALALRTVTASLVAGRTPAGDATNYLQLAEHLRAGQGLWIYDPYIDRAVRAFFPPFYPLLLGGWSMIAGLSTVSLSVLSLAIDAAAAIAIARLGASVGRPGAGRAAGWLYLIWPAALLSAPLAQKEGLCVLLIVVLANLWIAAARTPTIRRTGAIGIVAGLLALTQPGEAPLALLFGLAMVPRGGVRCILAIGLPAAAVAALVMAPWWIRNALVFHRFVPLTSAGGLSLWMGNNSEATGNWMTPLPEWRGLPELAYGARAASVARAWIMANPAAFVRLSLTKFVRTMGVAQAGLVRMRAMQPMVAPATLAALMPLCQFGWIALLGASAWAARVAGRANGVVLALIVACLAQMMGFGLWFEFAERHREFLTPFLLLFAVIGVEQAQAWRGGRTAARAGLTFPA